MAKLRKRDIAAVIVIVALLGASLGPVLGQAREKARRVNCAGNLKCLGLTLLMYSGDNGGYFPAASGAACNWYPVGSADYVTEVGKIWACPSAEDIRTCESNSNYFYVGSGKEDDNNLASKVSVAFDAFGNHPGNRWMNTLFIDGHVEGAKPGRKPATVGTNIGCHLR